jgi:hypothetical protein
MRGKIYVDQPFLIRFKLSEDVSTATAIIFKYIDPDGTDGTLTSITTESDGYTVNKLTSFAKEGMWTVWAYVDFPGYAGVPSEPAHIKIWKEGE